MVHTKVFKDIQGFFMPYWSHSCKVEVWVNFQLNSFSKMFGESLRASQLKCPAGTSLTFTYLYIYQSYYQNKKNMVATAHKWTFKFTTEYHKHMGNRFRCFVAYKIRSEKWSWFGSIALLFCFALFCFCFFLPRGHYHTNIHATLPCRTNILAVPLSICPPIQTRLKCKLDIWCCDVSDNTAAIPQSPHTHTEIFKCSHTHPVPQTKYRVYPHCRDTDRWDEMLGQK